MKVFVCTELIIFSGSLFKGTNKFYCLRQMEPMSKRDGNLSLLHDMNELFI